MSGILDTNLVVRYLTDDPPGSAATAARVIEGESSLVMPPVVIAEVAYVLTSRYGLERPVVVDWLMDLLQRSNLEPAHLEKGIVLQALQLCRPSRRVALVDALVWATARATSNPVYTFDRRFPREGIDVREP